MILYKCFLCTVGEHCEGDSNNAECECQKCEELKERALDLMINDGKEA
jgi:hypothetical protein